MVEQPDLATLKTKMKDIFGYDFPTEDNLLQATDVVDLPQGQVLFKQGEHAQSCFGVLSGNIKIVMKNGTLEATLSILSKGDFGGVLLMGHPPARYPGSIVALTNASLLVIAKDTYINHWTKNAKAFAFVNNCVRNRVRHLQEDKLLQFSDVENRVIAFLYRHYIEKKDLISTKITRKDIAMAIGAKTETVIRTIKSLERAGIVKTNKSIISILDKSYLVRNVINEK